MGGSAAFTGQATYRTCCALPSEWMRMTKRLRNYLVVLAISLVMWAFILGGGYWLFT